MRSSTERATVAEEGSQAQALTLEVCNVESIAEAVLRLELRDPSNRELPSFHPGSHLEVYLPGGIIRHYSLCNDSIESHRYCIGVALAANSRGGSRYIHDHVRSGATLVVSAPRNNFHLTPDAGAYLFIAGGIGITPILSMLHWCVRHRKPWKLIYCARSRRRAAFYDELRALDPSGRAVRFHFDDVEGGRLVDTVAASANLSANTHVYCCGPAPLMNSVLENRGDRAAALYHFEWFSAPPAAQSPNREFTVLIRSRGVRLTVPSDRSILAVLEEHGLSVPSSCREGLCGTCETAVLSGVPEHRDCVLQPEQRAANNTMMICVSRAQSDTLELDL